MRNKLWLNLFIKVALIFAAFVILVCIANSSLLVHYYTFKQEKTLINQSVDIATLNFSNSQSVNDKISKISEKYNAEVEIYEPGGKILFTTRSSQMMDFISSSIDPGKLSMHHEPLKVIKKKVSDDGATIETAVSKFNGDEFLVCRRQTDDNIIVEMRIRTQLISSSASIAGEFISIIAVICFILSLVWVFIFAKKFSSPITEMSAITEQMSKLDFGRKVTVRSQDEIGKLGDSINNLSDRLDSALSSLIEANAKLKDEIELEHQLDIMRKGFIANVSHELKTPISIISGYAEGLKLNINAESKNIYCDTIIEESDRMNRLVLKILELSKYESGQIPEVKETFDIGQAVQNMSQRIFLDRQDISLSSLIPENTLVFADIINTEQILKSFLENALAHVSANGEVKIFSSDDGKDLKIIIYNSGEKINPEIMPHIWESFFRGDASHNREESRFGLGLSIVSAIIKNQNKSCGVYNTDDGVCFWFTVSKA